MVLTQAEGSFSLRLPEKAKQRQKPAPQIPCTYITWGKTRSCECDMGVTHGLAGVHVGVCTVVNQKAESGQTESVLMGKVLLPASWLLPTGSPHLPVPPGPDLTSSPTFHLLPAPGASLEPRSQWLGGPGAGSDPGFMGCSPGEAFPHGEGQVVP